MSNDHEKKAPSKPSHIAYQVREGGEGKSYFNRVGSAFEHGDKQGFNIVLDSTPVDGRIALRTRQDRLNTLKEGKSENRTKGNQDRER